MFHYFDAVCSIKMHQNKANSFINVEEKWVISLFLIDKINMVWNMLSL
ncbi:hypothetical protein BN1221_03285 [Brenneria goodwinii]|uniref:Uncharacterized protein n=1 Tax=Brenneria goodwinii TaxID=1109412 RepID=A0A0G4JXY7_9GAMM|nr:hypothetical protein BN1221_03285 [Brenneria goodwinii]